MSDAAAVPEGGIIIEPPDFREPPDLRLYLPPWFSARRMLERDALPRGPARSLFVLAVDLMVENAAGPWIQVSPDGGELRAASGLPPRDFDRVWPLVRAKFVFSDGLMSWKPVVSARAKAAEIYAKRDARNRLGGNCFAVSRLVSHPPPADADDGEKRSYLEQLQRRVRRVIYCQERLLELGGRFGSRDWIGEAVAVLGRVLMTMSVARQGAYKRLLKVAAELGIDRATVDRLWQNNRRAVRDLALRHRYGILTFNALRLALIGQLTPWPWAEIFDGPEGPASIARGL